MRRDWLKTFHNPDYNWAAMDRASKVRARRKNLRTSIPTSGTKIQNQDPDTNRFRDTHKLI